MNFLHLFISVFFIDDQRGWAVGTNGIIFITTNGGSTWNFQYQLSTGEWLYDVFFINQNNGITVGDNGRILTSKDGGNSWDIVQSGISNLFRDVEFSSSNEAWAVGYGGAILYTTDIGDTWHTHQSGTTTDLFSASFINELKGWVCGDDQLILHNTSGVPVELVNFTATWQENQILLSWITASETNNFGFEIERKISDEWEVLGFVEGAGTTTEMHYYSFIDNIAELNFADKLFYRLKQLDLDGAFNYSHEIEVMLTQLTEYSLHQNFPNPFNPSTTISFDLPVNSNVILTILSSIGEQVTKLADGGYVAGTHQVIFNASNLSSGLYIYRIQAVGEDGNVWVDNKKMVLMK